MISRIKKSCSFIQRNYYPINQLKLLNYWYYRMKTRIYLTLILLFFIQSVSYSDTESFNQFLKEYSSVKSIKGTIVQYIHSGASVEKMSGHYTAVDKGWFRIDYTTPERQIVIANNKGLFWFYPERNLLFKKEKNPDRYTYIPGSPLIKNFNNINIVYQGIRLYGLIKYAHVYSFRNLSGNSSVYIWFDSRRRYVVRKYIIDDSGREIMKEIYHEFFYTGSAYIPSKIELFLRSENGIIHTQTEYRDLKVNYSTDNRIFDFEIQQNMTVRELNDN